MTVGTPVVVSRIQNRRGTQQQFDGYAFSTPGPNSVYPLGYTGIGGYYPGSSNPSFTVENYPNVLMPGELALCTDSRRMFIGNVNGEFSEILLGLQDTDLTRLRPNPFALPTSATWKKIDQLSIHILPVEPLLPTPFLSFLYSLTDGSLTRSVGNSFARNGELQITATASTVTLNDVSTEINSTPYSISFKAEYEAGFITVWYMHNFPSTLTFGANAITWIPLLTT